MAYQETGFDECPDVPRYLITNPSKEEVQHKAATVIQRALRNRTIRRDIGKDIPRFWIKAWNVLDVKEGCRRTTTNL